MNPESLLEYPIKSNDINNQATPSGTATLLRLISSLPVSGGRSVLI